MPRALAIQLLYLAQSCGGQLINCYLIVVSRAIARRPTTIIVVSCAIAPRPTASNVVSRAIPTRPSPTFTYREEAIECPTLKHTFLVQSYQLR